MPVPSEHLDEMNQKYCETCIQNHKDTLANKLWKAYNMKQEEKIKAKPA